LPERGYAVLTLHRPSNVDEPEIFGRICDALEEIQRELPIVFPVHPRTRASLERLKLAERLRCWPKLRLIEPLGYLDFLKLTSSAAIVLTDSGGIQEETTVLGVQCLTLRENTERPITIEQGTNQLVGTDPARIIAGYRRARGNSDPARVPEMWDGHAAERIVDILLRWHGGRSLG
jgi:UDP-N-acetylglucosamine 2-epimerase (non-hydrolysing)